MEKYYDDDESEVVKMAYHMQDAYLKLTTRCDAIRAVSDKLPKADKSLLEGMWCAIDAYIDMNE